MDSRPPALNSLPKDLTMSARALDHRMLLRVEGDLDVHTAVELRREVDAMARRGFDHLLVDLDGVTFIDSIGLGVLVAALKRLEDSKGALELVCSSDHVVRLFRITHLDRIFAIHPSLDAAGG